MPSAPAVPHRIVTLAVVAAAVLALSVSGQTYLAMYDHGHAFWRIAAWQLLSWGFWALLTPWLCRLCERLGEAPLSAPQVGRLALLGGVLIAAHLLASALVVVGLQPYVPIESYTIATALDLLVRTQIVAEILVYGMILVVGRMLAHGRRARRLAVREAQLEADVARARLEALRLEIQPHFLFNTLNSIAALIRVRANDQALKMLLGLGELMRATLDRAPSQVTPLAMEVAFTRGYVELQQVRFGDRLEVRYAIDPAADSCLVPAFLLQPIVENAFRHGIGAKAGPCRLEIGAAIVDGRLRLTVRDDGAGLPAGFSLDRHAGTGLSNIRTRLQNLYAGPAALAVTANPSGGGTLVTVDLPTAPPSDLAQATA
jgi:two-component system, LytTR family, sensor kinase